MIYNIVFMLIVISILAVVGVIICFLSKILEKQQDEFYKKRQQEFDKYSSWKNYSSQIPNQNNKQQNKIYQKPEIPDCIKYFGFKSIPSEDELKIKYRELAKKMHPDMGGNTDDFEILNKNYQDALLVCKK